jgi:hypothetical protein
MLQKPAIVPPAAPPVPAPQPRIFDAKIAGSYPLPDSEHQIEVSGEGKVAYSEQNQGPVGSFFNTWNYPYQSGNGKQWDFTGPNDPYAPVPTYVPADPPIAWVGTTTAPQKPPMRNVNSILDVSNLIQLDSTVEKGWVELPTCNGTTGEIPLQSNVANETISTYKESPVAASNASCKPADAATPAAAAATTPEAAAAQTGASALGATKPY